MAGELCLEGSRQSLPLHGLSAPLIALLLKGCTRFSSKLQKPKLNKLKKKREFIHPQQSNSFGHSLIQGFKQYHEGFISFLGSLLCLALYTGFL